MTLRQTVTPVDMLGRMNAGMRMIMWGPQTVGAVAAGVIGGLLGVRAGLWVAAVGALISVLPIALSRIPRLPDITNPAPNLAPVLPQAIREQGALRATA